MKKITDTIFNVGVNDHEIDLFEGQYAVPNGMAYNSYVIKDDLPAVLDTVEERFFDEWITNIKEVLKNEKPTYLIIQHMEPDHSSNIMRFLHVYPDVFVVGNSKTFAMIKQFFGEEITKKLVVGDGDSLGLGNHELSFLAAPMVHWPEVMFVYDSTEKVLFSADAFGKFGALDADEDWACEARRYYFGIVGKYGVQVQMALKKVLKLQVEKICALHGPALTDNLEYYINLYDAWSKYEAESEGVAIFYTSVYGHTKDAVLHLEEELKKQGIEKVAVNDLARCDMAEAVEDAFRYGKIVLATTTYNGGIFPFMNTFVDELKERNFQNKFIAVIENGSWAPTAAKVIKEKLTGLKNLTFAETQVTMLSSLSEENKTQIETLAKEIFEQKTQIHQDLALESAKNAEKQKKVRWVCKICGYIYEGENLPDEFTCPLCKHGKEDFVREEYYE